MERNSSIKPIRLLSWLIMACLLLPMPAMAESGRMYVEFLDDLRVSPESGSVMMLRDPGEESIREVPAGAMVSNCYWQYADYIACVYEGSFGYIPVEALEYADGGRIDPGKYSMIESMEAENTAPEETVEAAPDQASPVPAEPIVSLETAEYTYEQMMADLEEMQACFPGRIALKELGRSHDDRRIMEATFGDTAAPRHILIQASIHGREYMNTLVAMRQLEEVLRGYETASYNGKTYRELFEDFCFHIIPMSNPDGVTISQQGVEGIRNPELREQLQQCRKNDKASDSESYWKRWKANAVGVDLNRNFDSGWQAFKGASKPSFEKYKGEVPASEPETRAILSVAEEYPLILTISYHSTGSVIYWDYGSQGPLFQADRRLANLVAGLTGYAPGPPCRARRTPRDAAIISFWSGASPP